MTRLPISIRARNALIQTVVTLQRPWMDRRFMRPSPRSAALDARAASVIHCTNQLGPGGAERQLTYLASEARRRGLDHRVLPTLLEGSNSHYVPALDKAQVPVLKHPRAAIPQAIERSVRRLPFYLRERVAFFIPALLAHRPGVVHCWIDEINVCAGMAALLVGTPRIVLSTRNMNPTHFDWYKPWFKYWYEVLLNQPGVVMINNSQAGSIDYARWLGIDPSRISTVLNGLDTDQLPTPTPDQQGAFRAELGIPPQAPILAGVMRLKPEKRPQVFVRIALELMARMPELHAVLVGSGELEGELRAQLAASEHGHRVHLLGQRKDVPTIMSTSSALLLTSLFEGTPNVLVEAQHFGCPVVTTDAGGSADTLIDGATGFLHTMDDEAGLRDATHRLLSQPELRAAFAKAGPSWIAERFSLGRMVDETLALY